MQKIEDCRILFLVTCHFRHDRLKFLWQLVQGIGQFRAGTVEVALFTNSDVPEELDLLRGLLLNCLDSTEFSLLSYPYLEDRWDLTWQHKRFVLVNYARLSRRFTHFVYLEDDILFTPHNFAYWLHYRGILEPFGLLPAFLRHEFREETGRVVASDLFWPVYVPHQSHIIVDGLIFLNLSNPYNPFYVMDRALLACYVNTASFSHAESLSRCWWGGPERAAMGLCMEDVPPGFATRYVVPVEFRSRRALPGALIAHLPNNYAQNPRSCLGKANVATLFHGLEDLSAAKPWTHAVARSNIWERSASILKVTSERGLDTGSLSFLITEHDTMLYFNDRTNLFEHLPVGIAPFNLCLSWSRRRGRLLSVSADGRGLIDHHIDGTPNAYDDSSANEFFEIEYYHGDTVSVSDGTYFLSADSSGGSHCNAKTCMQWERFRILRLSTARALALLRGKAWYTAGMAMPQSLRDQPLFLDYLLRDRPAESSALAATITPAEMDRRRFLELGIHRLPILGSANLFAAAAGLLTLDNAPDWIDATTDTGQTVRFKRVHEDMDTMSAIEQPAFGREFALSASWGTTVFYDSASHSLRHGRPGEVPRNLMFVCEPTHSDGRGWLTCRQGNLTYFAAPDAEGHIALHPEAGDHALSRLVLLERGLVAIENSGRFLQSRPDGGMDWSAKAISWWEFFLPSARPSSAVAWQSTTESVDIRFLKNFIVDAKIRARVVTHEGWKARILIYGYPWWSHGRVYYDLCKHLTDMGYVLDIINWREDHKQHIEALKKYYDLVLTAPDGVGTLADAYGVPYNRMIVVSHHEMDIRMLIERKGKDVFDRFAGYGVVSEFVYCASLMQGVRRVPKVVPLGINYDEFHMPPADRLEAVGYGSSMSVVTYGVEWKRGHLAARAAELAQLPFKVAGSTANQTSFHDMPEFYRGVGAVLTSSISEAAQLPVMEAAAAGRLVIGTPVGHFPSKACQGGGILAPIDEEKFVAFVSETLLYYSEHPEKYREKCLAIQEAAKAFDWRHTIGDWENLIKESMSV